MNLINKPFRAQRNNITWAEKNCGMILPLLPATLAELARATGYAKDTVYLLLRPLRKRKQIITVKAGRKITYEETT